MFTFPVDWSGFRTVLCLGAHCDDIEIGCGGTLVELQRRAPHLRFLWVALSGDAEREAETRNAGKGLLGGQDCLDVEVANFRGSYFPHHWMEIKDYFEGLKSRIDPDLILTHWLDDRHQDHRVVAELTWNTFRDHRVLEYEIPKYEGDLGRPNLFVPLSRETVERKITVLGSHFPSQRQRAWFRPEVFRSLLTLRGIECNAESGFAEAHHARKMVV